MPDEMMSERCGICGNAFTKENPRSLGDPRDCGDCWRTGVAIQDRLGSVRLEVEPEQAEAVLEKKIDLVLAELDELNRLIRGGGER